jgi:hypothetical protein
VSAVMTKIDRDTLLGIFMAAMRAAIPELTKEQRILVRDVLDGMLRENEALLG